MWADRLLFEKRVDRGGFGKCQPVLGRVAAHDDLPGWASSDQRSKLDTGGLHLEPDAPKMLLEVGDAVVVTNLRRLFARHHDAQARPIAGLVLSGSTFYGTASQGGSSGYGTVFGLTVPPRILLNDINFGVQSNCFGFHVDGVFEQMVVIEASTNITASQWMPLQTNSLGPLYFCDPAWTNYPRRFYRARTQ